MPAFVVKPYSELDAVTASRVSARLAAGDRARLTSYAGDDARIRRFLSGQLALLSAAGRLGEDDVEIAAACPDCGLSHGRSIASGTDHPLYLALAHADGSAFAVASRSPIGIDAEPVRAARRHEDLGDLDHRDPDRIHADRIAAIDGLAPGRGHPLRRWTAIEAVLKADGRGLRVPPDAVRLGRWTASFDGRRYRLRTSRAAGCLVTVATGQRVSDGSRG